MSEPKQTTSVKLDDDTELALAYVLKHTKLKKHAVLVAAIREGLRVFIGDQARLNAAHAKEHIPIPDPENTKVTL